ncbi:dihydropteroate synthase [Halobiforma nitratireducens]|uniref:dihydropteroate synthase n=1 Tax=Halobiforma nitratireducens JCM 10879 TaxID=1227454 RepID=M0MBL4_9EURY|nr:dihydropteroate synthase [Halobiforma nitratireducens]EMA41795.1 dihydropteroate synthase [Halobiforma nitratireducens JCM 10879]
MRTVEIGDMPVGDGHPPRVMGVLNMSVESNYDPSVHGGVSEAVRHVEEEMVPEGADIIDIGLQSANPKNDWLPAEVERDRLAKALAVVDEVDADVAFSIETRYASVAEEAIKGGFDLVNDVCGFADPEMPEVCEEYDIPVVKMASPPDIKKPGHLKTIDDIFEALRRGGFTDKTILDPAFGGWYDERTFEDNWELFRRLREFRAFGRPILTATNREDFLGDLAGRPETEDQLPVSLAAATMEVERGAHIVRTHDIAETKDVVQVAHALGDNRELREEPSVVELRNVTGRELERTVSLRENTTGRNASASLFFQIGDLDETTEAALRQWADRHDLPLAVDPGADAFLSGTAGRLRDAVADVDGEARETLAPILGTVRSALERHDADPGN